jgi:hypothetical protein
MLTDFSSAMTSSVLAFSFSKLFGRALNGVCIELMLSLLGGGLGRVSANWYGFDLKTKCEFQ